MIKLLLLAIISAPLPILLIGDYHPNGLISLIAGVVFIFSFPMFMYNLIIYMVDNGVNVPSSTAYDEILRIRLSIEDKWRNK